MVSSAAGPVACAVAHRMGQTAAFRPLRCCLPQSLLTPQGACAGESMGRQQGMMQQ